MKAYKFRYESVLMLRKSKEERELNEYLKALKHRLVIEERISYYLKEIQILNEKIAHCMQSSFCAHMHEAFFEEIEDYRVKYELLKSDLLTAKQEEDKKQKNFLLAKKEVDIILKYKDKQQMIYQQEMVKLEEKVTEDIVISRYSKQKSS